MQCAPFTATLPASSSRTMLKHALRHVDLIGREDAIQVGLIGIKSAAI